MSIERLAQSETFYPGYEEAHPDITGVAFGIRRFSDGQWYDFNDSTFKASGWTTKHQALTEDDNGLWTYDTGWAIPDSNAVYQLQWKLTDGTGIYYELGPKININSDLLDVLADWINGGRLDLLLDAIPTTAMRGTDNAALATGVQLSAQGKLDVNAECDTALTDYGANTTVPDAAGTAPTAIENRIEMDSNSTKMTSIEGDTQDIQSRLPAALSGGNMKADALAISTSTDAADKLEASAETIVVGAAVTGTLSITEMTTNLTEATDDHFNGRIIIWTSGVLKDQATNVTDYDGTAKKLIYTATTEAPSDSDTFVLV